MMKPSDISLFDVHLDKPLDKIKLAQICALMK